MSEIIDPTALHIDLNQEPVDVAFDFAKTNLKEHFRKANAQIFEHNAQIKQVYELLCDEPSRQQYLQELAFLAARNINPEFANTISPFSEEEAQSYVPRLKEFMSSPEFPVFQVHASEVGYMHTMIATTFLIEQYRYHDIFDVAPGEIFIDCGACFGDTAIWAYRKGASKVYSFEPGASNLEILKLNIQGNGYDQNLIFPLAVGESTTTLDFFSGLGVAGAACTADEQKIKDVYEQANNNQELAQQYLQKVQCVKLDDWFAEHKIEPTFIKLDVEGAEAGAIKGAAETIKRLKPKMAICLYHKVEDMWELPLLVHSIVPEYKFYCKKNQVRNEFILYALV